MAWILEAQSTIVEFLSNPDYRAPFIILVLCGFGLPVPEEITLIGSGFLLFQGRVELFPIMAVCFVGTLIGDSIPFWVGRLFGQQALRHKLVRRAVHPERMRAIMRRFERQGTRAVFVCRFIPGLRLPAWFTAGTLGMPYARFLFVDALGAAIITPLFIHLGRASGEKFAELEKTVENLHQILGFVVLALAVTFVGHLLITRRWPANERASDGGPGAGATAGADDGAQEKDGDGPTPHPQRRAGDYPTDPDAVPTPPLLEPAPDASSAASSPGSPTAGVAEPDVLDGDRP